MSVLTILVSLHEKGLGRAQVLSLKYSPTQHLQLGHRPAGL